MSKPAGYTLTQIILHWVVVLIVLNQFIFDEFMEKAWEAVEHGREFTPNALVLAHVAGGFLVFVFVIWRISIKMRRGAPDLPADEPRWQQITAHAVHGILYLSLLAAPLLGAAAWFGGIEAAAELHEAATTVILAAVFVHFVGALYHRFVLKSGVMERMLRPER